MIREDAVWINILPSKTSAQSGIVGKWLCFGPTEELHLYKDLMNTLVEDGTLRSVKMARKEPETDPFPHKECVMCVFTSADRAEIDRVEKRLKEIGLDPSVWKSDADTIADWQGSGKLRLEAEIARKKRALRLDVARRSGQQQGPTKKEVFISYASTDSQTARLVVEYLENSGIPCWIAPRNITPGADYDEAIVDAIEDALVLVVLVTGTSNESDHVKRELELATNVGLAILPLRIGAVHAGRKLKYFLAGKQWVDLPNSREEDALSQVTDSVTYLLELTNKSTRS